jgi:hypothetical protein
MVPSYEKYHARSMRPNKKLKASIFHLYFSDRYILIKPINVTRSAERSQSIA